MTVRSKSHAIEFPTSLNSLIRWQNPIRESTQSDGSRTRQTSSEGQSRNSPKKAMDLHIRLFLGLIFYFLLFLQETCCFSLNSFADTPINSAPRTVLPPTPSSLFYPNSEDLSLDQRQNRFLQESPGGPGPGIKNGGIGSGGSGTGGVGVGGGIAQNGDNEAGNTGLRGGAFDPDQIKESSSVVDGLSSSFMMIIVSELGDETFIIAAIMAVSLY